MKQNICQGGKEGRMNSKTCITLALNFKGFHSPDSSSSAQDYFQNPLVVYVFGQLGIEMYPTYQFVLVSYALFKSGIS